MHNPVSAPAIETPRLFPPEIMAGVTLRNADLFPPYGFSMMTAGILTRQEAEEHRRLFAQAIGVSPDALQFQSQVHGTVVRVVDRVEEAQESDGLVTTAPGIVLCVSIADCAAVLLYDAEHGVVAGLHSGWRGTVGNIVGTGIEVMHARFGSRPEALLAFVSACASGERYIVRRDVAEQFPAEALCRLDEDQWLLDIRVQIRRQLADAGVPPEAVEMSQACTIGEERYHSYRRDASRSGRMIAFIGLRQGREEEPADR